jgi:spermidine synthase
VGGLGLGYTLAALLDDPRVAEVVVVEIEPDLVRWHRSGVVPRPRLPDVARGSLLDEPRVSVVVSDVRESVARRPPGSVDLVLLDVDNGPGFLLYGANADLYRPAFLRMCRRAVRAGGAAAVWSASESADLHASMAEAFDAAVRRDVAVTLDGRRTAYHVYLGTVDVDSRGSRAAR